MKSISVGLLAALVWVYSAQAGAISLNQNLDFNIGADSASSLSHSFDLSHTIPLELKPISFSSGIKVAAVKSLVGMNKTNDFEIDHEALCLERGYTLTTCTDSKLPADYCPDSDTYFKSCVCDTSLYTEIGSQAQAEANCGKLSTIETCSSNGVAYYKCECDTSEKLTCSGSNNYTGNADFCTDNGQKYYSSADCHKCPSPEIVNDTNNGCTCPSSWETCSGNKTGNGSVCKADGGEKYVSCSCPSSFKQCNDANNEVGTNECYDNGTTYYETCSCPSGWSECTDGGDAGAQSCSKDGKTYWSSCKQIIECEAPYYANSENKCVLWDDVAAVAKTCNELITATKNGNITGNILVWGTLNCKENEITLAAGQKLVGRAFFNGRYPEATDSVTNKFSKITWDFQTKNGKAIALEHNSTLSDLTLEMKSNVSGSWASPIYKTPALLEIGAKENIIFNNIDLFGDMSAADGKGLTLINATTGKITLQGKNSIRFKNAFKTNNGYTYVANSSTYLMLKGSIKIGQDASLNVDQSNGGSGNNFLDSNFEMIDNAKFTFNAAAESSEDIFDTASLLNYVGNKIILRGTSNITIKVGSQNSFANGIPITMYDNSVINFKGSSLTTGDYKNGSAPAVVLNMNDNSVANVIGKVGGGITLNNQAILRVKSESIAAVDARDLTLNASSKLIVKQNTTTAPDGYAAVFYSRRTQMNGNAKLYIEANRGVFRHTGFDLASTSAKLYVKITDTSQKVFGVGYSNPEVWLYKTVSNAPFYIETPGQNGYNGAEDDGMYLMPALGVSASDNSSTCSHMTGGYSSSKINRDLACWTHEKDANPNNNDYFKGRQCDRCSPGYRLTGVTHVSKLDSRFTSTKSDFNTEMSTLDNAMSF